MIVDSLLAALLVAGHVLADFVLQTRGMVRDKARFSGLAAHLGVVLIAQTVLLIPLLSLRGLVVVAGVTIAHGIIDRTKAAVSSRWPDRALEWFTLDQAAHFATLAAAWLLLRGPSGTLFFPRFLESLPFPPSALGASAVLVAAYAFNVHGGSTIVIAVLGRYHLGGGSGMSVGAETDGPARGQAIGILERWIVLTLVLAGQWGALGLLLAAKSVARFRDLDDRDLSEYYLIGTLTSVLVAVASALLAGAWLSYFGPPVVSLAGLS